VRFRAVDLDGLDMRRFGPWPTVAAALPARPLTISAGGDSSGRVKPGHATVDLPESQEIDIREAAHLGPVRWRPISLRLKASRSKTGCESRVDVGSIPRLLRPWRLVSLPKVGMA
jgi:hypothetical protein